MAIVNKRFKLRVQKSTCEEERREMDRLRHRKAHLKMRLEKFGTENTPAHFSCHNGFKLPYEMSYTHFSEYFLLQSINFYLARVPCECNTCKKVFGYSKKKEWRKEQ